MEAVEQFSIILISYEEEIRIRGDLLITIIDNRGTYSGKVAPYLGPICLLGFHKFRGSRSDNLNLLQISSLDSIKHL